MKEARAVRLSAALRDAPLRLLEGNPFDRITVRDICAGARVRYASFARHHAGKEALLDHVAAEQISGLTELTLPFHEPTADGRGVQMLCECVEEHLAALPTQIAEKSIRNSGAGHGRDAE